MLKYSLYKGTFRLCCTLFILPLFLCHTVTEDSIESQPRLDAHKNYPRHERDVKVGNGPTTIDVISRTQSPTVAENNATSDSSSVNRTIPQQQNVQPNSTLSFAPGWMDTIKSGALERTGFVVLGFMSIIVVFFIVRAIRLRHKKSKSRKYGIITSTEMEMEPLDNDEDDEEDTTLFDAQHKYSIP